MVQLGHSLVQILWSVYNGEGEENVWGRGRPVNLQAHTDSGVNCHARETYQRLGDDKKRE